MRKVMTLATIAVLMTIAGAAAAAEVEVKMLNKGTEGLMVFEPALVKIEPGDTVKFVATDKGQQCRVDQGDVAGGCDAIRGQERRGHHGHLRQAGRLWREMHAALRHGHGSADRGGHPCNLAEAKAVPQVGKAKQVFAALFEKLPTQAAAK